MTAEAAYRRLETAVGDRDAPFAVVDLDALHANAAQLVAQAGGLPVRVASKSVRCVEVLRRVLAMPGWQGVLAFTPAEACYLADAGIDDLLVAYPSADRGALRAVARRVADGRPERIVLMVDSVEGAALVATAARDAGVRLPVAIDVDTALRPVRGVTVGVLRSPVRTPGQAADLARSLAADPHLDLVALMAYDAELELFSKAGTVESVRVMRDAATGRARGFAFVEMATDEEAQKAAAEFNQYQMGGRALTVNEARPKPEGGFGGGGGYGGGGGGGGNRGGGRREPRW